MPYSMEFKVTALLLLHTASKTPAYNKSQCEEEEGQTMQFDADEWKTRSFPLRTAVHAPK